MAMQHEVSKQHNTDTLPFLMDHLPDFFRKKAEKELNETPENRVEILKEMKEIIRTEKSLKDVEFAEDLLIQFLRQSKYNARRAMTRLQNYVAFRRKYEIYFHPVTKQDFSRFKGFTVLPMRSPDGCAIILEEYGIWDPDQTPIDDLGRILLMLCHQSLRDPMTQINGFTVIHDMKNVPFKHLRLFTPYYMYVRYQAFVACNPARYKAFHIVNEPIAFKMIWNVFKTFLPEKIKTRIFFHSSPEGLLEHLPGSILPSQYGGDLKDYRMTEWMINAGEQYGKCPIGGQANYY